MFVALCVSLLKISIKLMNDHGALIIERDLDILRTPDKMDDVAHILCLKEEEVVIGSAS